MAMVWSTVDIAKFKSLGKLLQAKRDALDGTPDQIEQADVALAIGFSQPYVSKIERGLADNRIPMWPSKKQAALVKVYKFTSQEIDQIAEKFGLDLPTTFEAHVNVPSPPETPSSPAGNLVRLPLIAAQGGTLESHQGRGAEGRHEVVFEAALDGHRPEDCVVVEVFGSSMACEDVMLSLHEGSKFIIDTAQEPTEFDTVVCDLFYEGEWFTVLKIYGRTGHVVLHSYNEDYAPIVLKDGMELHKVGVYVQSLGSDQATVRRLNRQRLKAKHI